MSASLTFCSASIKILEPAAARLHNRYFENHTDPLNNVIVLALQRRDAGSGGLFNVTRHSSGTAAVRGAANSTIS